MSHLWKPGLSYRLDDFEDEENNLERVAVSAEHIWGLGFRTLFLWDKATGEPVYQHTHEAALDCRAFALSPDKRRVAIAHGRKCIDVWDARAFDRPQRLGEHPQGQVAAIEFLGDDQLVSCSGDGTVLRFHLDGGSPIARYETWPAYGLAHHPAGDRLAVGGASGGKGCIAVLQGRQLAVVREFRFPPSTHPFPPLRPGTSAGTTAQLRDSAGVKSLVWHPAGRYLFAGCLDREVRRVDTATGEIIEMHGHSHWVLSVALSADGHQLASAGGCDGRVLVGPWNRDVRQALDLRIAHAQDVAFDGQRLLVASAYAVDSFAPVMTCQPDVGYSE